MKLVVLVGMMAASTIAMAQDTRTVTEPKIPIACVVLKAELVRAAGVDGIALSDESKVDTVRLQHALDRCGSGKTVELTADGGRAVFLTGPLEMRAGVTLLVDKGVTLYGSRDPKDYELEPGSCGVNAKKTGCKALISGHNVGGVGIMGEGTIDGRGGSKMLRDGKVQEHSWWELSEIARTGEHQQDPRLIVMDHCDDFTMYRIELKNAPFFHVTYSGDGFTAWGVRIDTPRNARNTDGIDPGDAKNVTIAHTFISTGDDNVALKGDHGPVTNVSVIHNHFYFGHGMSIGSGTTKGVSALRVSDLTLDGADNGIRIKSAQAYGGLVHDAVYEDVCMRNVKAPIVLDTNYTANPSPVTGLIPMFQDITLRDVRVSGGGKIVLNGFDKARRIGVRFDGVVLDDPAAYKISADHADVTMGPGPVNFHVSGEDVTETGTSGKGTLGSCEGRFVAFPRE